MSEVLSVAELGALIESYRKKLSLQLLKRTGSMEIVEEAIADATLTVLSRPHVYDPQRGSFDTWFFRITLNLCTKKYNEETRLSSLDCLWTEEPLPYEGAYFAHETKQHEYIALRYANAPDHLIYNPDNEVDPHAETKLYASLLRHRHLIEENYITLGHLTLEEQAQKLNLNLNTVKSRRHIGKQRMMKALNSNPQEIYEWRKQRMNA